MNRATPTPSCSTLSNLNNCNGLPAAALNTSMSYFSSPNFTMSPQGKFVQRLCQVEAENKLLRSEVDALKKWKTGLESWLMDGFGLVASGSIVNYLIQLSGWTSNGRYSTFDNLSDVI